MIGRRWVGALLLALAVAVAAERAGAATFDEMVVFGDSYSDPSYGGSRATFKVWTENLRDSGAVRSLRGYAVSGATAQDGSNSFKAQVDAWVRQGDPLRANAVCVAYFGYNDIRLSLSLEVARAAYGRQVDRLVQRGCTSSGRYLLLVRIHQWCRTPGGIVSCSRTTTWNSYVDQIARRLGSARVRTVDVYGRFERIFADPAAAGYSNVTTSSRAAGDAGSTVLYWDRYHFGWAGHRTLASIVAGVLRRL